MYEAIVNAKPAKTSVGRGKLKQTTLAYSTVTNIGFSL